MAIDSDDSKTNTARARIFATFALAGLAGLVGYGGHQGYRAVTDSFVAPMILSPDNDVVLQTKAKLTELEVEQGRIVAEADALQADLVAADRALERLHGMKDRVETALEWTKNLVARQAATSRHELSTLARERGVLEQMLARQERISGEARRNLSANLVTETDQAREQLAADHVRLALLDNERTRAQHHAALEQASFATRSLSSRTAVLMPEMIAREEQMTRIELEIARIESEQRSKAGVRKVLLAKLAKLDELHEQLKGRPLFRATAHDMEVAFVPYTQSQGVGPGAVVYDCVWSIFHCAPVGSGTELVPGEVVLPDPWGSPARGQYAVLDLSNHASARAKVLRVRVGKGAVERPQAISAR
jgi:hypothetical protein